MECEKLYVISMLDGILYYQIDHPESKKLIIVHSETYEEAADKLKMPVNF